MLDYRASIYIPTCLNESKEMINTFNSDSCIICKYPITDPMCTSCYVKQILMLLDDLNVDSMISDYIEAKLKHTLYSENLNDTRCILCKNNTVYTCRHCFSIILIRVLRELNFTEDLIENFGYNPLYGEVSLENGSISDIEDLKMEI